MQPFRNRAEAGRELAARLRHLEERRDLIVLGLPRGGVPVGRVVADVLHAPLDVLVVRKIGVPERRELAMGAIASGGALVLDDALILRLRIGREVIHRIVAAERRELDRRERLYRNERPAPHLEGMTVLLVDDGLATGSTMRAAIAAARQQRARQVMAAVPVASADTCQELAALADDLVCLRTPEPFHAVGLWYEDFTAISDEEVQGYLATSTSRR